MVKYTHLGDLGWANQTISWVNCVKSHKNEDTCAQYGTLNGPRASEHYTQNESESDTSASLVNLVLFVGLVGKVSFSILPLQSSQKPSQSSYRMLKSGGRPVFERTTVPVCYLHKEDANSRILNTKVPFPYPSGCCKSHHLPPLTL